MANRVNERTKIVWICNPNNPTGTMVTHDEIVRLLEKVPDTVLVVLDEAYCEYVTSEDYPDTLALIEQYPNVIALRTFSENLRTCLPAHRIRDRPRRSDPYDQSSARAVQYDALRASGSIGGPSGSDVHRRMPRTQSAGYRLFGGRIRRARIVLLSDSREFYRGGCSQARSRSV